MKRFRKLPAAIGLLTLLVTTPAGSYALDDLECTVTITDSAGEAVSDVEAFWYRDTNAKKISAVEHRLTVPDCRGLIVVHKPGHHYAGIVLSPESGHERTLILRRLEEDGPIKKTLPSPIDKKLRASILQSITEDYWGRIADSPKDPRNLAICLAVLAKVNPEKTFEYIEANEIPKQFTLNAKRECVAAAAASDFDLAVEVANSVKDPMFRNTMLSTLLKKLPFDDPNGNAIEEQFVDSIKSVPQPQLRLAVWASLAEHYVLSNRSEQAKKIVEEHLGQVKKLPTGGWSGYPRSLFAALIVNDDPQLAAELIDGLDENERNRALGRLAFYSGRADPSLAADFLNQLVKKENEITAATYHVRTVHRMASDQPDAAVRVAKSIDEPNQRAWALGQIAKRLSKIAPEKAKSALAEAVKSLEEAGEAVANSHLSSAETMGGLLPIAENVLPGRVDSMIWQAVWLAIPRSRWSKAPGAKTSRIQSTSAAISRYDRTIANALVAGEAIAATGYPSRAMKNLLALDAEDWDEFNERMTGELGFLQTRRPYETAIDMLTADQNSFWNLVSLPSFFYYPSERFEDY